MIIVKTKMNILPKSCSKCNYYEPSGRFNYTRCCHGLGKTFDIEENIKPTVERSKKCPLIETFKL